MVSRGGSLQVTPSLFVASANRKLQEEKAVLWHFAVRRFEWRAEAVTQMR